MKHLLTLELPYPNRSGNRHVRHGNGSHYLSEEALAYRRAVRKVAEQARAADLKLRGPLEVRWVLAPPDGRDRDQTNVLKVAEDALVDSGVLFDDNNKVIPRTVIDWVEPIENGAVLVEFFELKKVVAI